MQPMTPGITKANTGLDGIVWSILGQTYVPKQLTEQSFAWHATLPPGTFVPPHIHPTQDEFVYMLEGRLDAQIGLATHVYGAQGRFLDAAKLLTQADPNSVQTNLAMGWLQFWRGDFESAVGQCRQAFKINSNEPEVYLLLGRAYAALGQYREAIIACGRGRVLAPERAPPGAARPPPGARRALGVRPAPRRARPSRSRVSRGGASRGGPVVSLLELAWFPPLMLAVAIVLGVTGARGRAHVVREARRRFVGLGLMVVIVGITIQVLVMTFA